MTNDVKNVSASLLFLALVIGSSAAGQSIRSSRRLDSFHTAYLTPSGSGTYFVRWKPVANDAVPLNQPFDLEVSVVKKVANSREATEPALGLTLNVEAAMPAHHHGMTVEPEVIDKGHGHWLVRGLILHMPGDWQITFHLSGSAVKENAEVTITVE